MVLIKLSSPSRQNGHNFSTSFEDFTLIGDTEQRYEIALVSAAIWYSWYNVSAELGNDIFSYKTSNSSPVKTSLISFSVACLKNIQDRVAFLESEFTFL